MSRWRDVKKGNIKDNKESNNNDILPKLICAPIITRIKAFVTDMFMLMMPIMYVATYIILSGKDEFQGSEIARWLTMFLYGLIVILFWTKKGQTPGYKAYSIKVIDSLTKENISFLRATFRYILFIVSAVSIFGAILPFFRKDRKTFQDLMTNTCVILEENES
jgi:uncharacterized RDD family membrane protein YckC